MRAALTGLLFAVSLLAAPLAKAAPPAPQVTVGADIKQLIFDWDSVTGAGYYRLLYKIGAGAYKPLIDNIPASTTQAKLSIAVHLLPWTLIHYAVAACNTSGCTNSAAISPQNLMLDSIGYFKASNSQTGDRFGHVVILSDDGRTLAVAAPRESSNASGVNGNQADNSSSSSGAVYVFHRVTSGWRQEAYLKAGVNQPGQRLGSDIYSHRSELAINADGTLLAVGAPEQDVGGISKAGVVYIYQKSSSGSWSLAATLTASTPLPLDRFGFSVNMSLDGRTLKVDGYAPFETSTGKPAFRSNIFVRPDTAWEHAATLAGLSEGETCENARLSRDGNALVMVCRRPSDFSRVLMYTRSVNTWFPGLGLGPAILPDEGPHVGVALNLDASQLALQDTRTQLTAHVVLYGGRSGWTGFFSPQLDITGPRNFGNEISLSRSADLIAIADSTAAEQGAGVSPISMPGTDRRGVVYVWKSIVGQWATTWTLRSAIKSPNPGDGEPFGKSLAMCGTGQALAVGVEEEDSKASGIGGDRTDNSHLDSGAVYMY